MFLECSTPKMKALRSFKTSAHTKKHEMISAKGEGGGCGRLHSIVGINGMLLVGATEHSTTITD